MNAVAAIAVSRKASPLSYIGDAEAHLAVDDANIVDNRCLIKNWKKQRENSRFFPQPFRRDL